MTRKYNAPGAVTAHGGGGGLLGGNTSKNTPSHSDCKPFPADHHNAVARQLMGIALDCDEPETRAYIQALACDHLMSARPSTSAHISCGGRQ